jgi:hypothetical protein
MGLNFNRVKIILEYYPGKYLQGWPPFRRMLFPQHAARARIRGGISCVGSMPAGGAAL